MPIINTDIIRPNEGPAVINGYDPTADTNDFRGLGFENTPSSGTALFSTADSIDQIVLGIRCRCFRGAMRIAVSLRDNAGLFPTFISPQEELDFTTLETSFTTNAAGDPITTSTIKGLEVSSFSAEPNQAGSSGDAFRIIVSDIFITVISSNIIPTRTITLDSGAITLDSGKITVQ